MATLTPSLEIVLLPFQTLSVSGTSGDIVTPEDFNSCILKLATGVTTGTSPTLNMYVQQKLGTSAAGDSFGRQPSGTASWDDLFSFTQIVATGTLILRWMPITAPVAAGAVLSATQTIAPSDAALAAGSVRLGPLGRIWRLKWVITGTSPTFPGTYMVAQFLNV